MLARAELNYYPEENLQVKPKIKRKQVKKKKNLNSLVKLIFIFTAILFLITSLFILFRYAKITSTRLELTQLERYKLELEKTKLNLVGDLEGVKSSLKISDDAINKLGMVYPEEGQVVYLSVDKVEHVASEVTLTSQIKKVLNLFSFLF